MTSSSRSEAGAPMSTTTVTKAAPADRPAGAPAPTGKARRRGETGPLGRLTSHGILIVASLIALFPVVWLVYLSLGPDKDDSLRPGVTWGKVTLDNYGFVLQASHFFHCLKSSPIVSLGTSVLGVLVAATTGYAV